jgi:hypothetical protein
MEMPRSKFSKATSMSTLQILMIVVIFTLVAYGVGYLSGRLHGYHQGLDKGNASSGKVNHLKGMTDGYVMALQHTPAQRNEYMNNVLLKINAMTPAQIEQQRQQRFRIQIEG